VARSETLKRKVLLVDDHPLMRRGLAQLIALEKDLTVCGEAEDVSAALKLAEQNQPDVAVVDISLGESSGIDLIKDFKIRLPHMPVLVLSMHDESFYAERVLRAGARGYVTKGESSSKVLEGIRQLLEGRIFLSEAMSSKMLSKIVGDRSGTVQPGVDKLSDREFQVLEMIGHGQQSREIAEQLHLSVKTIDAHRENIKRKLGLADAAELLKYAIRWVQSDQKI
jgi:DNA-binding NarL/FixJ family response regulator